MSNSDGNVIGFARHSTIFDLYSSPLRPCAEDTEILQRRLAAWRASRHSGKPANALLLGVTPEIATGPWAAHMDITALDVAPAMIQAVWPGDTAQRRALQGNWLHPPLSEGSVDIVFGDGVFTLLPYPAGYHALAAALARVVRRDGIFLVRAFCRPAAAESVASVFADVRAGHIGNLHVMKWRLAAALQGDDPFHGVVLGDIWRTFCREFPDATELFRMTGWPPETLATLTIYRDSKDIYAFPSADELIQQISPWFECVGDDTGKYELAERCPTLSLALRAPS